MPAQRYDVVGVGNAIVDVIAQADDAFIADHGLNRGGMTLIDAARALELYDLMPPSIETSGGSAANTIAGVAGLGGRVAYVGKVRDDQLGAVFRHDLRAMGVGYDVPLAPAGPPTARCLIVVTPDAQRTMNTYLGVASLLSSDDLDEDAIAEGAVLYMEGYLFDRDDAKKAFRRAAGVAHLAGRTVSLTLSDSFCVDRHRADFAALVRDEVDILFGNDVELCSLYELDSLDDAIDRVRGECELAAITCGKEGSYVVTAGEVVKVPPVPVPRVLDTTGAGDLYAAGFLYGYTRRMDLAECGRIGSVAAAEVISHVGPRPLVELRTLLS